jgi:crotonobetainyl-CoA:carnitine CoA-transferase CaiB-like acyl-CoA transferase
MSPRMLQNVLMADFTRVFSGPAVALMLGYLGANIVKIEDSGTGDDACAFGSGDDSSDQAGGADGRAIRAVEAPFRLDAAPVTLARGDPARVQLRAGEDRRAAESGAPRYMTQQYTFGSTTS